MFLQISLCLRLLGCSALSPQCFNASSFLKKKKKRDKLPHFLFIYLSRSKGLVTTWLERKKIKLKPRSPCAVFVQWDHMRSGLRKAAGQVIIKKRKFVPENLLGSGSVRALLLVHSDPSGPPVYRHTKLTCLCTRTCGCTQPTRRCSRLGLTSMVAGLQSVRLTVCFHLSCLCMTGYGAPVL